MGCWTSSALVVVAALAAPAAASDGAVAVGRIGATRFAVEIKLTQLTGTLPPGHDEDQFVRLAQAAIVAGFAHLAPPAAEGPAAPVDLVFYLDFHPHMDSSERLSVSAALFSEFDCVTPLYRRFDDPCGGPWATFADVFAHAARDLESAMIERLDEVVAGTGTCELAPAGAAHASH